MLNKITLSVLLWSTTVVLIAQTELTFLQDDQIFTMEERMAQEGTQGASVIILKDGQTILYQQWGFRETAAELPVEANTIFQVGSLSQPVMQFAILQLVGEGVLDLDTDVNQYLSSWQLPSNRITKANPVTIRDLLLQRRGFKFPYKPDGYGPEEEKPTHLQLLNGEAPAKNPAVQLQKDLNKSGNNSFAPALILQQILMDHYQQPFPELMREQVFEPLGMQNSSYATELTDQQREQLAVGYLKGGEPLPNDYLRFAELAAAGLYTTAEDYARFLQAVISSTTEQDNPALPTSVAREALQPEANEDVLLFNRGDNSYSWGGAPKGYYCQFDAALDGSWVVVAFLNDNINWRFNGEIRYRGAEYARQWETAAFEPVQNDK